MTVVQVFFTFLVPLLIGLAACLLLASRVRFAWVVAWMAPGLGIGIASILFFLWSLVYWPRFAPGLYATLEVLILLCLGWVVWRVRRAIQIPRPRLRMGPLEGILALILIGTCTFFSYRILVQTLKDPLSTWDAWTFWNAHARFLLLGDAQSWRNVFSTASLHSDYPFLLSGFIGRSWVLLGKDRAIIPAITAALFTASTVGLLVSAVTHFRGLAAGLLAGILITSLPEYSWAAATQYADIPIGLYFLIALVLLYLSAWSDQSHFAWLGIGVVGGLALWTKNEGASFLLSIAVVVVCLVWWECSDRKRALSQLGVLALGLLPVFLLYLGYKAWLVPKTDLFEGRSMAGIFGDLSNLSRYKIIAKGTWDMVTQYGSWKLPFFPLLGLYSLVSGLRPLEKRERAHLLAILAILALTFAQYLFIYLISPHDLHWHMATSYNRLIAQLLPGFLLGVFLFIKSPGVARR